ncbi:MAG: DUF488 domain-containing protein [Bacteroidetes bacterium]|nr:DUF488 domain-containing protein [Bacteroidota bacterium]
MTEQADRNPGLVFTIGHSTRTSVEFIGILKAMGITLVADVRTIPRSRHNPQFNLETLPATLKAEGIGYTHLPGLGGLRHTKAGSPNLGWRNASFRGFADYMQTQEFVRHLDQLIDLARDERVAVMCAEVVPWRCHRSLIADALVVRGIAVKDIISETACKDHALTPWAKVHGEEITYPPTGTGTIELHTPGKSPK